MSWILIDLDVALDDAALESVDELRRKNRAIVEFF